MTYAIKVIWKDGEEEYLRDHSNNRISCFLTKRLADEQKEFMAIGMDDDCQSINVVPYPRSER